MSSRFGHRSWRCRLMWAVAGFALVLVACILYARWLEPHWLKIRTVRLGGPAAPPLRICHISDLHYTARDRDYLERVCRAIGKLRPDLVCFTGDLADSEEMVREALEFLTRLDCPVYGVSGNHDGFDRTLYENAFAATGGRWLENQSFPLSGGRGTIIGLMRQSVGAVPVAGPRPWLLLVHTPQTIDDSRGQTFDLILAGHSHGGQIRLPFVGALVVPYGVGKYDRGLFRTPAGPLHVSPGLGIFFVPVRFGCRPELTLLEL